MAMRWLTTRRIRRAERRLRREPSPHAYLELAQAYLAEGLGERALEVVRKGREKFPRNGELASLEEEICWSHLRQRARQLQARIDADPKPKDIVALARIFLQVGDLSRALDTLSRGLRQFPEDTAIALSLAKLRLKMWRRDLLAADGLEAVELLERVLSLDDKHSEALRLAAEVHLEIGAWTEALEFLERLASCAAEGMDEEQRRRLDRLSELARERSTGQTEHDLEVLFEEVEARRRRAVEPKELEPFSTPPAEEVAEPPPGEVDAQRVLAEVGQLANEETVRAVLVQRDAAAPQVLAFMGRGADEASKRALAAFAAAAVEACERINIGRLRRAVASCRTGSAGVTRLGEITVAFLAARSWRFGRTEERLAALEEAVAAPEGDSP